ncbi:hypothetical protein Tco_1121495 [Tanacetum coccineum]|uniref:Uncharacterized protein n=1 Tax=Tanacetum coccineum TaxID=301880 RepID=A0ABQ5IZ87_9ASTR
MEHEVGGDDRILCLTALLPFDYWLACVFIAKEVKEEEAGSMEEPTIEECMTFTQSSYDWVILEDGKIELKGQLLIELGKNAYSGTSGEDAVEHIENFLKVTDLIKVPKVSNNQIRVRVFPFSLTGAASK